MKWNPADSKQYYEDAKREMDDMTTGSGSPGVMRDASVGVGLFNPTASVIVSQ